MDHLTKDLNAALTLVPDAAESTRRERLVTDALWSIIQNDTCQVLRAAARARYLEITDGKALK